MTNEEAVEACKKAANRLHHVGMRYAAAAQELAKGEEVGLVPAGTPGLHEFRDLTSLILYTRAELNGLTRLLIEAGILDLTKVQETFADEYQYMTDAKAKQFNIEVTDYGIVYKAPKL